MKALIANSLLFLCIFFIACDDKNETPIIKQTITITLKNTESHSQDLGLLGIEDGATIKTAPLHSEVSSLNYNLENRVIYSYKPTAGFIGKDKVQIEICRSPGDGSCYAKELTTINFTVTD